MLLQFKAAVLTWLRAPGSLEVFAEELLMPCRTFEQFLPKCIKESLSG